MGYLWAIGHIPIYQSRIEIWYFTKTYEDRLIFCEEAYSHFKLVVESFCRSSVIPSLLSIILAAGNYLNGNTNRGQADGFEIIDLEKLHTVKDNINDKLKSNKWVFEIFLSHPYFENIRKVFDSEMSPILANIRRKFIKNSEGTEILSKTVSRAIEDFDILANQLKADVDLHNENVKMCQQFIEDPADPFKTVLLPQFHHCQKRVENLFLLKNECKKLWEILQIKYHFTQGSSSDFFLAFDDLFIPKDYAMLKPEAFRKRYITPAFCNLVPPTLNDFKIFWDIINPDIKSKKKEECSK